MKNIFLFIVCSNIFHLGYIHGSSDKDSHPRSRLKDSHPRGLIFRLNENGLKKFDDGLKELNGDRQKLKGLLKDIFQDTFPELLVVLHEKNPCVHGKPVEFINFVNSKGSELVYFSLKEIRNIFK